MSQMGKIQPIRSGWNLKVVIAIGNVLFLLAVTAWAAKASGDSKVSKFDIPLYIYLFFVCCCLLFIRLKEFKRRKYLFGKYRDEKLVESLLGGYFWKGQSTDELKDSIGDPIRIERQVLKTKTKEIWKYCEYGVRRYRLRITIEENRVVSWVQKW